MSDHAVPYHPSQIRKESLSLAHLKAKGIKYIRMQWVDLVNHVKCRIIPLPFFEKLLETPRPGITLTSGALGFVFYQRAAGFSSVGEHLFVFELSTLRICPYAPGHASVFGYFEEKLPKPTIDGGLNTRVEHCPRTTLKRITEQARHSGIEFLIGFETEFVLLKKTNPLEPVNHHGWFSTLALPSGSPETKAIEEIVENLTDSGVEVQSYHAESTPGQYEIITGPLPVMDAVDVLVHTRETIFHVANKHGLRATFVPKPFSEHNGTASHVHISIHSRKKNKPSSVHINLSHIEATFLNGLLHHLPSITLLALPTPVSYKRVVDGFSSGGTYVCWGTDNREAPIRLCNATASSPTNSRNFEVKCLDGTANAYLALAAFLSAGMQGISLDVECEMRDCGGPGVSKTAARMGEGERRLLGIWKRMPLCWEDAKELFGRSEFVDEVFGKDFKEKYVIVHERLRDIMSAGTEEEQQRRWVENY